MLICKCNRGIEIEIFRFFFFIFRYNFTLFCSVKQNNLLPGTNPWPPFRIPTECSSAYEDPRRILETRYFHAVIWIILYKAVHVKNVSEHVISLAAYLLEMALSMAPQATANFSQVGVDIGGLAIYLYRHDLLIASHDVCRFARKTLTIGWMLQIWNSLRGFYPTGCRPMLELLLDMSCCRLKICIRVLIQVRRFGISVSED